MQQIVRRRRSRRCSVRVRRRQLRRARPRRGELGRGRGRAGGGRVASRRNRNVVPVRQPPMITIGGASVGRRRPDARRCRPPSLRAGASLPTRGDATMRAPRALSRPSSAADARYCSSPGRQPRRRFVRPPWPGRHASAIRSAIEQVAVRARDAVGFGRRVASCAASLRAGWRQPVNGVALQVAEPAPRNDGTAGARVGLQEPHDERCRTAGPRCRASRRAGPGSSAGDDEPVAPVDERRRRRR